MPPEASRKEEKTMKKFMLLHFRIEKPTFDVMEA
jgi:hypothetical protein